MDNTRFYVSDFSTDPIRKGEYTMGVVIGIDVGGSTTKIGGFRKEGDKHILMQPLFVRATDPITSIYGAFGRFTNENDLALSDIDRVVTTGVGSSYITKPIYSLECDSVPEFRAIGLGGLYLSGLERAVVVSMGTGTALVYAEKGKEPEYLGGTGVGGGTLMGLSKKLLGLEDIDYIQELAKEGDLSHIDLRIGDITRKDRALSMPDHMTAANFGKISDAASAADLSLGLLNMVFETVGMMAVFNARAKGVKDIVLTGNLTSVDYAKTAFEGLSAMFGLNFVIPENARFSTVIGTAMGGMQDFTF
jgi:type II pantothenate kinase